MIAAVFMDDLLRDDVWKGRRKEFSSQILLSWSL
ncbi:hypothetical protein CTRC69_02330 [Chlamydia trachomatis RC-F/69]|nr:hypothetical protein G9768_02290 [Chlamydia trachomatis G/9768]ADH19063.1 hypothetical protein G11222_02295 [Chlamydia trachomatis G/11222]ADH19988.1 hypothetical protein G11074_02295 [Chlamydia trachomatis G/11074]ADH97085.1 hypothetical protein CTG9301_02300 [Chlamydia trachomatis G/9301]AGR93866.1 hypothetical protein CTRC69_02330 [Chlamydia trachomatis RC-F/69]AGR95710.1 hypothetical protein CTRC852_02355 [Chlamydia trachomatis RC-F(s)/852]AGR99428.1 hypothetical protein CTRC342_02340 